jgi:hypothetical protein
MILISTLLDKARALLARDGAESPLSPLRSSFLDAPRVNPVTGTPARKCLTCNEWYPLDPGHTPDRSE